MSLSHSGSSQTFCAGHGSCSRYLDAPFGRLTSGGRIRNLKAWIVPPLVAVSALSGQSEFAESIQSGFDRHFVKPTQIPGNTGCDRVPDTRSQFEPLLVKAA